MIAIGRTVRLRVGDVVLETIDSIRLSHVVAFARQTGKPCPTLSWLAEHPGGDAPIDWRALVDELQQLAQARPPEDLAPLIGLLRNDATRAAMMARAET